MPDYAKEVVQKLVDVKALNGTGGTVNGKPTLNLSYDLVRTLVILDRMGLLVKTETATATKTAAKTTTKANIK